MVRHNCFDIMVIFYKKYEDLDFECGHLISAFSPYFFFQGERFLKRDRPSLCTMSVSQSPRVSEKGIATLTAKPQ